MKVLDQFQHHILKRNYFSLCLVEMEMTNLEFNEPSVWVCFVTNLGWICKFRFINLPKIWIRLQIIRQHSTQSQRMVRHSPNPFLFFLHTAGSPLPTALEALDWIQTSGIWMEAMNATSRSNTLKTPVKFPCSLSSLLPCPDAEGLSGKHWGPRNQ